MLTTTTSLGTFGEGSCALEEKQIMKKVKSHMFEFNNRMSIILFLDLTQKYKKKKKNMPAVSGCNQYFPGFPSPSGKK
jgi:hypothetical protein